MNKLNEKLKQFKGEIIADIILKAKGSVFDINIEFESGRSFTLSEIPEGDWGAIDNGNDDFVNMRYMGPFEEEDDEDRFDESEDDEENYLDRESFVESLKKQHEEREALISKSVSDFNADDILNYLVKSEDGMVDSVSLAYESEEFPFSYDKFYDFWNYLREKYEKNESYSSKSDFPDFRLYFNYKGIKFIHRLLMGQGSCQQFIYGDCEDWPEEWPMKYNEEREIVLDGE